MAKERCVEFTSQIQTDDKLTRITLLPQLMQYSVGSLLINVINSREVDVVHVIFKYVTC